MSSQNQSKIVLITGASSGFGQLTAQALVAGGHHVFATMRDSAGRNRERAAELEQAAVGAPGKLSLLDLDVTDGASVAAAVAATLEQAGRIDVLVNNAGQGYFGPFAAFSDAQLRRQFDVNFFGPAEVIRAVLPSMRERRGGLIVNVSSGLGRVAFPGTGVYAASKFAMEAMSEVLRYEASMFGVDVVSLEPGAFNTGIADKMTEPDNKNEAEAYGPLANTADLWEQNLGEYFASGAGNPQDVVDAIVGLIESDSDERPARVVIGQDVAFVDDMNRATLESQRAGLEGFGMGDFAPLVR